MDGYHDLHHPSSTMTKMNDPHVETLQYRLLTEETEARFEAPSPREGAWKAFRVRLADGILTVTMTDHHATEASARAQIEPFLRAWSIKTALDYPRLLMRFDFIGPTIVDRDPPPTPPGSVVVPVQPLRMSAALAQARVHIGPSVHREYPEPPVNFLASPDVETMWQRYDGYVHTREPLLTMAYFCLTVLEWSARDWPTSLRKSNSRRRAAEKYAIDYGVLDTLGRLTSRLGGAAGARKRDKESEDRAPTNAESAWVESAIKALILQLGRWEASPSKQIRQLTMRDLPSLP